MDELDYRVCFLTLLLYDSFQPFPIPQVLKSWQHPCTFSLHSFKLIDIFPIGRWPQQLTIVQVQPHQPPSCCDATFDILPRCPLCCQSWCHPQICWSSFHIITQIVVVDTNNNNRPSTDPCGTSHKILDTNFLFALQKALRLVRHDPLCTKPLWLSVNRPCLSNYSRFWFIRAYWDWYTLIQLRGYPIKQIFMEIV